GPPVLESIVVTPASTSVEQGASEPLAAMGTFSDGSTQDLAGEVTWSSSAPSVAVVSAAGVASGLAPGTASISARIGTVGGLSVLTVTVSPVATPTPTPTPAPVSNATPTPTPIPTPSPAPISTATPPPTNPQFVASGLRLRARLARIFQGIVASFKEPQA